MGGRASPPPCALRWANSWPAALLAASILNSCVLLSRAQGVQWATSPIPVTWEPLRPSEGQSVTLTPGGSLGFLFCRWYRGDRVDEAKWIFMYLPSPKQRNGPAHTGRETGGPNCSLHIKRLTSKDSGNYTVSKRISRASSEIGVAYVTVLGSRAMRKSVVAGIAIGAILMAVVIGFLLHCALCGCCCFCPSDTPGRRFPPHQHDLGLRRHTV